MRIESMLVAAFVASGVVAGCNRTPTRNSDNTGRVTLDVQYAPTTSSVVTTFDAYTPPDPARALHRAVLVIHGGAWRGGTKGDVAPTARLLAIHGYVAIAVNYTLAPQARWPQQLVDVQAAVRHVRAHAAEYGVDPDRIGAWGPSAGGHLATMLALVDDPDAKGAARGGRVAAAVDAFGPADLTIAGGMAPDEEGIIRDLLGASRVELSTARLLSASTVSYARRDASVLILHGTADTFVSIEHSERLYDALLRSGATTNFLRVPGGGHDGTTNQSPETWPATLAFLDEQLGVAR